MVTTGSDHGAQAANNTLDALTSGVGGKEACGPQRPTGNRFREGWGFVCQVSAETSSERTADKRAQDAAGVTWGSCRGGRAQSGLRSKEGDKSDSGCGGREPESRSAPTIPSPPAGAGAAASPHHSGSPRRPRHPCGLARQPEQTHRHGPGPAADGEQRVHPRVAHKPLSITNKCSGAYFPSCRTHTWKIPHT